MSRVDMPSLARRFWRHVPTAPSNACWEWTGRRDKRGYGVLSPGRRGLSPIRAHRLSLSLVGIEVNNLVVMHICDNPGCVNPEHLQVGSQRENLQDMTNKGRRATGTAVSLAGERNPRAKLCKIAVAEIKRLATDGVAASVIAQSWSVDRSTVYRIIKGARWES